MPSCSSVAMLDAKGLRKSAVPISCGVRLDDFHPDSRILATQGCAQVREHYGLDVDQTLLLYVGRIDVEKRVDVLVQAMACLPDKNIQLAIAGTGGMEAHIKRLINTLNLEGQVHLLGGVPHQDLPALLNCADIFVMPGDAESFSIATLEAMACGKPVLAANSSALPELVTQGVNGTLFEPGSSQDAARGIMQLIRRRDQWGQMGRVSMERAHRHRLDAVMGKYERIYLSSVMAAPQPAAQPVLQRPLAGLSLHLHYSEQAQRHAFRPLTFLVMLGFLLCSILFSTDSTYAAPDVPNQDLATIDLADIRNLLVISPDDGSTIKSTDGLIRAVIDKGGQVQIVVLPDSTQSAPGDSTKTTQEGANGGRQTSHALTATLLDLGIPEEMVSYFDEPAATDASNSGTVAKISGAGNQAAHLSLDSLRSEEKDFINKLGAVLKDFKPDTILVPDAKNQDGAPSSVDDLTQLALAAGYLDSGGQSFPLLFAYLVKDNQTDQPSPDVNGVPAEVVDGQSSGWYRFPASQAQSAPSPVASATPQLTTSTQAESELYYQVPIVANNKTAEPFSLARVWRSNPLMIRELHVEDSTCYALQVADTNSDQADPGGHTLGACVQSQHVAGNHTALSLGVWDSGSSGMDVWRMVLVAPNKAAH